MIYVPLSNVLKSIIFSFFNYNLIGSLFKKKKERKKKKVTITFKWKEKKKN